MVSGVSQPGRTISILEGAPNPDRGGGGDGPGGRPWIGVRFLCAGAYVRVPRNADGSAYLARCPRCGKMVRFRVGQGGTNQRFFDVSC